jgi:hypothetical protein
MALPIHNPSARPMRNNGGAILGAGTVASTSPVTTQLTLIANNTVDRQQDVRAKLPTGTVGSSGNLGVFKANSTNVYNPMMNRNSVIARGLNGQYIAGTSGVNFSAGSQTRFRPHGLINRFYGYQRLNITGWSYTTGAATYGSNRGVTVLLSGFNGVTGQAADDAANPSMAIPGELTFLTSAANPSGARYGRVYSI